MFNHARTLLVNRAAAVNDTTVPGTRLISAEFEPVKLPSALINIRSVLFGTAADQFMLNYRTSQLLNAIAATDMVELLWQYDSRSTSGTTPDISLFNSETFSPQVVYNPANITISLFGEAVSPDAQGLTQYRCQVTIGETETTAVTVGLRNQSVAVSHTSDNVTVPLPGTGYFAVVPASASGELCVVTGYLRPTWDLGQLIVILEQIGEDNLIGLFGLSNSEPDRSLREVWETNPRAIDRISAITMALIRRTEEIRQTNRTL